MLLDEASTGAHVFRTNPEDNHPVLGTRTGRLPTGTATYHCYRYARLEHGLPTDTDGTVILGLPATPRAWHHHPWHQYETGVFLDAEVATAWLGDQLRAAATALAADDPQAAERLAAQWRECRTCLDRLESACHTSVAFPGGNLLGLAIVAIWDSSEIHPLLRVAPAAVEGSAS